MITIRDKINIGGWLGIIHIGLSIILSIVMVLQSNLDVGVIFWNIFVFNLPVLIDFAHTFSRVPAEKVKGPFKYLIDFALLGLLISFLFSLIGIGICLLTNYNNPQETSYYVINFGKKFLNLSILFNPIGVLSNYMCSILIEEHRIETEVEANTN